MSTIKHTVGARVHVLIPGEDDWLPGRILDAHVFRQHPALPAHPAHPTHPTHLPHLAGTRARYVVLLDDDRRLVAHNEQVRSDPPRAWAEAAMAEVLDMAS